MFVVVHLQMMNVVFVMVLENHLVQMVLRFVLGNLVLKKLGVVLLLEIIIKCVSVMVVGIKV